MEAVIAFVGAFIGAIILTIIYVFGIHPIGGGLEKNENNTADKTMDVPVMRWNYFMDLMVKSVKRIYPPAPDYKIKQKILGYNTLMLGIYGITPNLVSDVSETPDNWNIFTADFLYNWKVSDDLLEEIRECWKKNNELSMTVSVNKLRRVQVPKISKKHMDRLMRMCTAPNPKSRINVLLQRYSYYGDMKEGLCLSAKSIYDFSKDRKVLEAFAGPLNSNLPDYCSLFSDLEKDFGSLGSFLMLPEDVINEFEYVVLNPPYMSSVMEKASEKIAKTTCGSITIIPDWRSKEEVEQSKSTTVNLSGAIDINKYNTTPYPAFNLLLNSPMYSRTFTTNSYMFENFFSDYQKKLPETDIIIVVLGDTLADELQAFLTR